jgi:hypothetical protein
MWIEPAQNLSYLTDDFVDAQLPDLLQCCFDLCKLIVTETLLLLAIKCEDRVLICRTILNL